MQDGVETEYSGIGNLYVTPRFADAANGDFSLAWDNDGPSPCINAGYPGANNDLRDPDGTLPDIGSHYFPHHQKTYRFDRPSTPQQNNIFWMSFPVVDDRTRIDEQDWNELGYMFMWHMDYLPDNQIVSITWNYPDGSGTMVNIGDNWDNSEERAIPPKGYKLKFNPGYIDPVEVSGFKSDALTTPVLWRAAQNGVSFESWIGYFVPYTQRAGDAFSKVIPGSSGRTYLHHIHTIKTQTWSASTIRPEYGSAWIINPNRYTFSEGAMAVIHLLPDAPQEMYWNTTPYSSAAVVRASAENFTFAEKLDYLPIYIELDREDLPAEVGIFVNGICKGAAVPDSSLFSLNYYYDNAKSEAEIEIAFYYEGKGKKIMQDWTVYNPERMVFEKTALKANQIRDYAYLSFAKGADTPLFPINTELHRNFPNPFNPETKIAFTLAQAMPVTLEIYNVKGQKLKTLISNAQFATGRHSVNWNGRDDNNRPVASGLYFSRLRTPAGNYVQKMTLMK